MGGDFENYYRQGGLSSGSALDVEHGLSPIRKPQRNPVKIDTDAIPT